jgi:hypothetical protein
LPPPLKNKNFGWRWCTWIYSHLSSKPLRVRDLKEGAVVTSNLKEHDCHNQRSWKGRNGDTPIGYSGWTALWREHCDM